MESIGWTRQKRLRSNEEEIGTSEPGCSLATDLDVKSRECFLTAKSTAAHQRLKQTGCSEERMGGGWELCLFPNSQGGC